MTPSIQHGALSVALLSVIACGPKAPPKKVDGQALVRAALLDGTACYAERPEYCIDDEAFVQSAIDMAVERRAGGSMPEYEREVEQVVRSAKSAYRKSLKSPAGLAKIEEKVAAYWADPRVDTGLVAGIVSADLGAPPGTLAPEVRGSDVRLRKSEFLDGGRLRADEVGRQLARLAKAHPDADEVRIQVVLPRGRGKERPWVYRWSPGADEVVEHQLRDIDVRFIPVPDGSVDALAAGRLSFDAPGVRHCSARRSDCGSKDRYAEAAKAAERE